MSEGYDMRPRPHRQDTIWYLPDRAEATALTFASSVCDQPLSMPSAGPIPTFYGELPPTPVRRKPKPLLGEMYMTPNERPTEPL